MPELAEVEFYRKRWALAGTGAVIQRVHVNADRKVFRGTDAPALQRALIGRTLGPSQASAKQMLFRAGETGWLGIHLGMSGELFTAPATLTPGRHDHLVLFQAERALVFRDPRMFGRILHHEGPSAPEWWRRLAPPILSAGFTVAAVTAFLQRRRRSPLKAVLLQQERFPGVGNWMADEILWRAALPPARPAGALTPAEVRRLWAACRQVCRQALAVIAGKGDHLPADLNVGIPRTWLFLHRWRDGGRCPRTGQPLARATIGGRTTCWSPARLERT
jgi:formamidopyrimidine-DNA glycosylase